MNLERDLQRMDFILRVLLFGIFVIIDGLLTTGMIVKLWR